MIRVGDRVVALKSCRPDNLRRGSQRTVTQVDEMQRFHVTGSTAWYTTEWFKVIEPLADKPSAPTYDQLVAECQRLKEELAVLRNKKP